MEITQVTQVSRGEGNNDSSPPDEKKGQRIRKFFITWNNYTEDNVLFLLEFLKDGKYIIQEEKGKLKGTPHLQGHLELKNAMTLTAIRKKLKGCDVRKTINEEGAKKYCSKLDTRNGRTWVQGFKIPKPPKILALENMYIWQKEIVDLCAQEPDDRTINWFWEKEGGSGKTQLIKYLVANNDDCQFFSGGSAKDCISQIILRNKDSKGEWEPRIVIWGITREAQERPISYNALEQIKDGMINSGKYEGGTLLFNSPHVIIFANVPPDTSKLSRDRWNVTEITKDKCEKPIAKLFYEEDCP